MAEFYRRITAVKDGKNSNLSINEYECMLIVRQALETVVSIVSEEERQQRKNLIRQSTLGDDGKAE